MMIRGRSLTMSAGVPVQRTCQ